MHEAVKALKRAWAGPLAQTPRPWLNPDRNMMVLWSAKSACTTSFVWFLNSIGWLEDFRRSRSYAHRFRRDIYEKSDLVRRGRAKLIDDYTILHIIRDPYTRAVSSYRQALKFGFADRGSYSLPGSPLDRNAGFSFTEFLDVLGEVDLTRGNVHWKLQVHPVEALRRPERVINISRQDLFEELTRVEEEFGLPHTDCASLDWLHRQEARRKSRPDAAASGDSSDVPFTRADAEGQRPWPDYQRFLTPAVRRRIERLYARDFEAFAAHL